MLSTASTSILATACLLASARAAQNGETNHELTKIRIRVENQNHTLAHRRRNDGQTLRNYSCNSNYANSNTGTRLFFENGNCYLTFKRKQYAYQYYQKGNSKTKTEWRGWYFGNSWHYEPYVAVVEEPTHENGMMWQVKFRDEIPKYKKNAQGIDEKIVQPAKPIHYVPNKHFKKAETYTGSVTNVDALKQNMVDYEAALKGNLKLGVSKQGKFQRCQDGKLVEPNKSGKLGLLSVSFLDWKSSFESSDSVAIEEFKKVGIPDLPILQDAPANICSPLQKLPKKHPKRPTYQPQHSMAVPLDNHPSASGDGAASAASLPDLPEEDEALSLNRAYDGEVIEILEPLRQDEVQRGRPVTSGGYTGGCVSSKYDRTKPKSQHKNFVNTFADMATGEEYVPTKGMERRRLTTMARLCK